MRKYALLFLLFFFSLGGFSQRTIKGRVVGAVSGLPIPGCSVFIAGTSKGTISNNEGRFELNNLPGGINDLIVSSIGYQTSTFSFNETQLPLQVKVEMQIKVKELENVVLESSIEEGWDKWGKTFWDTFVGNTKNSLQCKIKNQKAIHFRYFPNSKRLIAYSDEPILLENKALGYTVSYELETFEIDFKRNSASFLGHPLFIPLEGKKGKWEKNREEAYKGSIMHFMRSLYTKRLIEEGFEVRRLMKVLNFEKQRVRELLKQLKTQEEGGVSVTTPADSMKYYRAIITQEDSIMQSGRELLTADSLIIKNNEGIFVLQFENYIHVVYKNELEEEGYRTVPLMGMKMSFGNRLPQQSYAMLLGDKMVAIAEAGNYFNPQDFCTFSYWAWGEKMANALPFDYELPLQ